MVRFDSDPPSSSSSSTSSSYFFPNSRGKYDVFLSFRGEDTRKNFTDHLYEALKRRGIVTFRDDDKLQTGDAMVPELFKAIQESWCSVIVFSETYCSSSWCLEELSEIIKQKNENGHKVFPIFYGIDPSDLRKQAGKVAEAFAKYEEKFKENKEKTERWRNALIEVANIKGWHLNNRHESVFIGEIINKISTKLCQTFSSSANNGMIGIESRLEKLLCKIDIGDEGNRVRVIGICVMGGIGKTTLARLAYTQISTHFESKSFLADVREVVEKNGLLCLQKQLLSQTLSEEGLNFFNFHQGNDIISHRLSQKKVLIVIDDVDNMQHLNCLVGSRAWFGLGSRIIITTRDEHLLQAYEVDDVYKPTTLNAKEALHLFSLKAFKTDSPANDFVELSKLVVNYAGGLPLALEVLGSFLCGREATQWRSTIERLKKDFNKEILDRLRISFDGLEETEKNLFLDIACFFKGEKKDFVMKILDGCDLFPDIGIDVLIKKSLVRIDEFDIIRMHDLLQEMGRKIVRQQSPEPGKRCRLWEELDVNHVLTEKTATEAVEGIVIDINGERDKMFTLNGDAFLKMKKLRLLRVFNHPNCRGIKYLSNELRLLEWHGYPFKSLPSSFQPDNLVALLLPYSRIEQLWKGDKPLRRLKLVNVEGSQNLTKTPDFSMIPNLETLVLDGTRIVDVHPTIVLLQRLKFFSLRNCKSLRSLPTKIGKESLETLILSGCSNIQRIPDIVGEMEGLLELYLNGTAIKELPTSIGNLSNLVLLNLKDCSNLVSIPDRIDGCNCLRTLNLSGCSKVANLPENLQLVDVLEELDLSETAIRTPPSFIFHMKNLKVLSFQGCNGPPLTIQSRWPFLSKVNNQGISPISMGLTLPASLLGLSSLKVLNLSDCNLDDGTIPVDIGSLSTMGTLILSNNNFITLPASLNKLSKLTILMLANCKRLKSLPVLPTSITKLWLDGCTSLEEIENSSSTACNSVAQQYFCGFNCFKLAENNNVVAMLRRHLKVTFNARKELDIFIPGNEIPQWFSHQRIGSSNSIRIPLPLNLLKDDQFMGFAFCCVFSTGIKYNTRRMEPSSYFFCPDCNIMVENICCRNIIDIRNSQKVDHLYYHLVGKSTRVVEDHIWLHYWPCNDKLNFKDGEVEIPLSTDEAIQGPELEVLFKIFGVDSKVKKYGVRPLYNKDLEEINQIIDQHGIQTCSKFDDIHTETIVGLLGLKPNNIL